ncbi:MAG TPA: thiamine phosphate synthase [Bryobacteraceae bacterium]|nr:thiamine phosphate synthase [Bryobacteraceae bacterium]
MSESFGLYLVLTDPLTGYEACAAAAVETGVRYVQLRMKKRPRQEVLETARRLRRVTAGSGTLFIVNDNVEIAVEADADGVHLGQDDMTLTEARRLWPSAGKVFGLSTHNEEQEVRARELAPDYIGVGPVFPTPTKEKPDPTLGLERMGRIVRASPLTTVPIGGIDKDNLPQVLAEGAVNYCVLRAVNLAPNPKAAILALQETWRRYSPASMGNASGASSRKSRPDI